MTAISPRKRVVFFAVCAVITAIIIVTPVYLKYRTFIKIIYQEPPAAAARIRYLSDKDISRLGLVLTDRTNSFVNFPLEKEDLKIRIGCFGDSYTYGEEVSDGYDYPALLQDMFKKNGRQNIEVINFGSPWHGFQQAFIMWKYVGAKFDLDYVVFAPACFFNDRDFMFNHTYDFNTYYLHARHVLKNGKIHLIDVAGRDTIDRNKNYYRFIPRLRYLLYDKQAPAFLRCFKKRYTHVKNPFYYMDPKEEKDRLYSMMLKEIGDNNKYFICGFYPDQLKRYALKPDGSVKMYRYLKNQGFPYTAIRGHNSPLGNDMLAKQVYNSINNKSESIVEIIQTGDIEFVDSAALDKPEISLNDYDTARIEIAGRAVGGFVIPDTDSIFKKSIAISRINSPSLIAVKHKGINILDGYFIPLEYNIDSSMKMVLRIAAAEKIIDIDLGQIKLLNEDLNIGVFDTSKLDLDGSVKKYMGTSNIELLFNDEVILYGLFENNRIFFIPAKKGLLIRANEDGYLDTDDLRDNGHVYIALTKNDKKTRISIAKWSKQKILINNSIPANK